MDALGQRALKDQVAIILASHLPSFSFGACARPGRQPHAPTTSLDEGIARTLEESPTDPAPLVGLFYEKAKNVALASVGGGKADDFLILDPDEDSLVIDIQLTSSTVAREGSRSRFSRTPALISMIRGMSSLFALRIKRGFYLRQSRPHPTFLGHLRYISDKPLRTSQTRKANQASISEPATAAMTPMAARERRAAPSSYWSIKMPWILAPATRCPARMFPSCQD